MNFITGLPISKNWKGESHNSIPVIINWLTKNIYYKLIKVKINTSSLAKVIVDIKV